VLDHVVVNIGERMDAAVEQWRRLGFQLTPRGYHTLGSINHLAMFGTDYLELIGAPSEAARLDIADWPTGLNGLVFGTEDSSAVHAMLTAAGVACFEPGEFSRPVVLTEGTRDAVFRTVRLPHETTPAGRIYFCQHFTRELVWRDTWRRHPNGSLGVAEMMIATTDPERLGGLFRRMFGASAVSPTAGGLRLAAGLSSVQMVSPPALAQRFGEAAAPPDGREEWMAALVLRTSSLAQAAASLEEGTISGIRREPVRLVVPASQAWGVTLEFREGLWDT
jgi:hypothetical protein